MEVEWKRKLKAEGVWEHAVQQMSSETERSTVTHQRAKERV
jgi:hypothetical protein